MRFSLLFLISFSLIPLAFCESPWGEGASLAYHTQQHVHSSPNIIVKSLIRFHQRVLSPADGPRSHFSPSSSSYAYQAFSKHGLWVGYLKTCDRLMRENSEPWVYPLVPHNKLTLKWDPVR